MIFPTEKKTRAGRLDRNPALLREWTPVDRQASCLLPGSPEHVGPLAGRMLQGRRGRNSFMGGQRVPLEMAYELGLGFSVDFVERHEPEGLLETPRVTLFKVVRRVFMSRPCVKKRRERTLLKIQMGLGTPVNDTCL